MELVDYRKVDSLYPYQLEIGDLVSIDDEIVHIVEIADLGETYAIFFFDKYEEKQFIEVDDSVMLDLFVVD